MVDKNHVNVMLNIHRQYRNAYLSDLECGEDKYKILCALLRKEVNNEESAYRTEKDILKKRRIIELYDLFEKEFEKGNIPYDACAMWEKSLRFLGSNGKELLLTEVQWNEELLETGKIINSNYDKMEFNILMIELMNNKGGR